MALFFFVLFAVLFLAIIALYIYSFKLKKKTKESANKFSLNIKIALSQKTDKKEALRFLSHIEQRIHTEGKYKKNPEARKILLSKVFQHKAAVLFKHNDVRGAIKACTQALEMDPSHVQTLLNRGTLYSECMEYDKAIEDFNEVELIERNNPNLFNNRGWAYSQMGRFAEAIEDFTYGISLQESATLYFNRGNAFLALNESSKALSDYQKAREINTNSDQQLQKLIESAINRTTHPKESR